MNLKAFTQVRVGEFQVDSNAQRLWKDGRPVDLVPQAWALFRVLLEHSGQLVTKDEILASAWPDVEVSDAALSQAVKRLRTVFGDDARTPRYIETVHRRGFRLIAPTAIESPAAPAAGSTQEPMPFVGRTAELARMDELLQETFGAVRQLVFIEGEAGIGKTTLLRSFQHQLPVGVIATAAQCVEQHGTTEPYLPVLEALDRLAGVHPETVEFLRRYAPTWLIQVPWLIDKDEAVALEGATGDASPSRMMREMARALEAISATRSIVLVVEDLHWADEATVDLIASIACRRDPARLMVIGTYRPAEAIAFGHPIMSLVRRLTTSGTCTRLSLETLSGDEVQVYLAQRFAPNLASAIAPGIRARSEGNPLFVTAVADHLVARGLITGDGGEWRLARSVDADDLHEIPNNLREMIDLQLSAFDARELEVLEAASVAAVEFRSASVAAALDMPGVEGVEQVEALCERLVTQRQMLRPAGEQTWPDRTRTASYRFRHQLYRQSLYEQMPASRRRRFHQRIGDRLERGFAADPRRVAGEMAIHFDQSGDDAKAASYFALAAHQAHRRFADREAADLLRSALSHLDGVAPGRERDVLELQMRTGIMLAHWLAELGEPPEESHHLERIRILAPTIEDGENFNRLCLRLWNIYVVRSLPDLAKPLADHLVASTAEHGPGKQLEALIAHGLTALMRGELATGVESLSTAYKLFGDGTPPDCARWPGFAARWEQVGLRLHGYLAVAFFLIGRPDTALSHALRTISLSEGQVPPKHATAAVLGAAGVLCMRGDVELAQTCSDRGLAMAQESALTSLIETISPQRAWLAIRRGTSVDPQETVRAALCDYLRSRSVNPTPVSPLLLADVCRMTGLVAEGRSIVDTVWRDTRDTGLRWYDAELRRLAGELALMSDERRTRGSAKRCFDDALRIAREQGARSYELRAATSLCRLSPDSNGARNALEQAYAKFDGGFDTPDLKTAAAMLNA